MSEKSDFLKELKGLGSELSTALKQIQKSQEFQELRKEVETGIKRISSSLLKSLSAAKASPQTKKIKSRVGRVVKAGAVEGSAEVKRAQKKAAEGLKKVRSALRKVKDNAAHKKNSNG